ncbi:MAG: hypothetical protein ACPIOQ_19360, partial [Promethearchaeia archaeon]
MGEEQDLALLGRQLNVAYQGHAAAQHLLTYLVVSPGCIKVIAYQGHAAAQHLLARLNTPKRMRAINQIEAVHLLHIIQGATVKPAVFDPRA